MCTLDGVWEFCSGEAFPSQVNFCLGYYNFASNVYSNFCHSLLLTLIS
jgi:hypothetical protein